MDRKNVVLVARDAAPSRAFSNLIPILQNIGFNVNLCAGDGKPLTRRAEEIICAVEAADLVVLGMSSSEELATPEILAGKTALDFGIPYGFYGDVRRC